MGMAHAWGIALADVLYYRNNEILSSLGNVWPDTDSSREVVSRDWSINTRQELIAELGKLRETTVSRHKQRLETLERVRHLLQPSHVTLLHNYGFMAWDMVRYSFLVRMGHELGYISDEETWEFFELIRPTVQTHFPDWYEFGMSYVLSAWVLHSDDLDAYALRENGLRNLMTHPLSPWRKIEWSTCDTSLPNNSSSPKDANPLHIEFDYQKDTIIDDIEKYLARRYLVDLTNYELAASIAYKLKKYASEARAIPWFFHAAALGSLNSIDFIGYYYELGKGELAIDLERAETYYRQGIKEGSTFCKYRLSLLIGALNDPGKYSEAMELMKNAAVSGYVHAQIQLGIYFKEGKITEKNYTKAVYWFQQAANQNNAQATNHLGTMYAAGLGVGKDPHQAFILYRHAAEQGDAFGANNVARRYASGEIVSQDLEQAFQWYLFSAERGYTGAMYQTTINYYEGKGVVADLTLAKYWATKGTEAGDTDCMRMLAWYYYNASGYEAERDHERAFELFDKVWQALPDDAYSLYRIAEMLYQGINGQRQDRIRAFELFKRLVTMGDIFSHYYLGCIYYDDNNAYIDGKDIQKALVHFKQAAEHGDHLSQFNAGNILFYGEHGERDIKNGLKYFELSAKNNYSVAREKLASIYFDGLDVE